MLIIKQFPVHKCGHEKNPIAASDCLLSQLKKNKDDHYFLATQDPDLTEKARKLAYVPLIYLKMNTIVMEKPQGLAVDISIKSQESLTVVDDHQIKTLKILKKINLGEEEQHSGKMKKKKGPKGPNPLSCKKKKIDIARFNRLQQISTANLNKKRRKRKGRMPNHIKRMFNKIENDFQMK